MGILKVYIKPFLFAFYCGCLLSCNGQSKNNTTKSLETHKALNLYKEDSIYVTKKQVLGKFDYTKDTSFILVPKEFSSKKTYIRKEVLSAFLKMQMAAKKENISFKIISRTRNFTHQKRIWNYKWNEKYKNLPPLKRVKKILEYSSMPSTSRHHWGTDVDLNSLNNSYFSDGKGKKAYNWLVKNASKFGYYQVYTSKENGRLGYNEEKWHWSYLPSSSIYLKFYNENIDYKDITGFNGYELAKDLDIIKNYVNGINSKTLN